MVKIRLQFIALVVLLAAALAPVGFAQTQYSIGYPSPEQQYMLELINRARANGGAEAARLQGWQSDPSIPPFSGGLQEGPPSINGESFTIANSAQPLSWNVMLNNCAQARAKFLNDNDQFFSGLNPHTFGGTDPEGRINAAGYPMHLSTEYNGPKTASGFFPGPENVAENESFGSGPFTGARLIATILQQHNDLFTDTTVPGRGHRMSMMLTYWREIGIGISSGSDNGQNHTWDSLYTVQNFGRIANSTPLITGFILTGTQPKKVIIRAIGPSLNLPGQLANPTLELYTGNTLLGSNDDWRNQPPADKQAVIDSTIPPSNDLESALVRTLPANGNSYTAIVRGVNNTTGIGVVEVFDIDHAADSRLANISTRGFVQTGDNVLIAGTIVLGQTSQKVVARALGPSLNIPGQMANPTLELVDSNGTTVAFNDNWRSNQEVDIIATGVPPANDLESAIVATLSGNGSTYTAIVRGANNSTGIAVVEVFAIQ